MCGSNKNYPRANSSPHHFQPNSQSLSFAQRPCPSLDQQCLIYTHHKVLLQHALHHHNLARPEA